MAKPKPEPSKDVKATKQSTLMGFFGKPKPASMASQAPSTTTASSPASTALKTPSSLAGSSPLTARPSNGNMNGSRGSNSAAARVEGDGSPLKKALVLSEDDLSPPPVLQDAADIVTVEPRVNGGRSEASSSAGIEDGGSDVPMGDEEDSPMMPRRRTKRKVIYAESEEESEEEVFGKKAGNARKPRKSLKADSDSDDFVFDEADDAAMAAAAEEFEISARSESPFIASASGSPAPTRPKAPKKNSNNKFKAPTAVPKKTTTSWNDSSTSSPAGPSNLQPSKNSRPGPAPLIGQSSTSTPGGSYTGPWSDDLLLTKAERSKLQAKETARANEECYSFLKDVRDIEGRKPNDPEYDKSTIFIPKNIWKEFTPFENQFWLIKQKRYDTVLFFQKGKFYELYEDDALIGHQEFDLKLTDRVKMKMVGVPEQSFEFWAAKFVAAGHKVGKVEQVETAIGKSMRDKNGGGSTGKEDKIVRRELAQVFTNGTIVDSTYLTSDEANHCVAIKEHTSEGSDRSSFGICTLDASTGEFQLTAFNDDVVRTRLTTMFRQIRPKEIIHAKGNLSVETTRLLRNILPSNTLWQSFKPSKEFYEADQTLQTLSEMFETENDEPGSKPTLPDAINNMLDKPIAMEALGGMMYYLKTLNLDKDLVSQRNFNVYDPIREGRNLVLDGQTLGHMEVLVNNEGGTEGTLLELLQRCSTPFGKRLFRIWLQSPLREIKAINDRLDAVQDLMDHPDFVGDFTQLAKQLPDLERLISRIHALRLRESEFLKVVDSFKKIQKAIDDFIGQAENFESTSILGLLRNAPDMHSHNKHISDMFTKEEDLSRKTVAILPTPGANDTCDEADAEVEQIEGELEAVLVKARKTIGCKELQFWHSAQGGKEIYQIAVPAKYASHAPNNWTKTGGTNKVVRFYPSEIVPIIRRFQEAKETQNAAKKGFFQELLAEFDKERDLWLKTIRVIAELDCLVSLARASSQLDEPKCRPEFIEIQTAMIEFTELRHPAMCLRSDNFIPNNVQLGGDLPRQVLLTGPNMAGKSTLLRMTAAGVIMAQMGCWVPASRAVLAPVDKIQTRMGAYDNMFASASTFKVELDECSKILREAGPKSFVILDELGRGTSTYDGMAIAGAVLHHLATHTLPLGFFATHYGSLTDDFSYHPNVRKMHMQTHVDDEERRVVFLYKLIPGVAESSHGTHVANMAGVPREVVARADQVSQEFFQAFKEKLVTRRRSKLPLVAHADFAWLLKLAMTGLSGNNDEELNGGDPAMDGKRDVAMQMDIIRRAIGGYVDSS